MNENQGARLIEVLRELLSEAEMTRRALERIAGAVTASGGAIAIELDDIHQPAVDSISAATSDRLER